MAKPLVYVAVDLETTGVQAYRDDIVEIAAVHFEDGVPAKRWSSLVRSRVPMPEEAFEIHGLGDADLGTAARIEDVLPDFVELVGALPIVAHNAGFDVGFLSRELAAQGLEASVPVIDTLKVARERLPRQRVKTLDALCRRLGVRRPRKHRAEADAVAAGLLLWKMLGNDGVERRKRFARYLRTGMRLEPMFQGTWSHDPDVLRLHRQCPPGCHVEIDYASGYQPHKRVVTVEFFSRTQRAVYLVGACHDSRLERRTFRVDRIVSWRRIRNPFEHLP